MFINIFQFVYSLRKRFVILLITYYLCFVLNEKTIYSFLDSKFPESFDVFAHSINEGISAFVFDLNYKKEFVARVINYRELPKPFVVVDKAVLDDLSRWFEIGPHRGEKIFESWLNSNKEKLVGVEIR